MAGREWHLELVAAVVADLHTSEERVELVRKRVAHLNNFTV